MNGLFIFNSYSLIWVLLLSFLSSASGSIRLSSPEVIKASWNARNFLSEDLNKDGLNDLLFFNLERSRIEILYRTKDGKIPDRISPVKQNRWDPVLEDAPYKKEYIFIPEAVSVISTGDLNQDGLQDIICGSPINGVCVYFRTDKSSWSKPMELESYKIRPDSISLKVKAGGKDFNPKLFLFTEQGLEEIEFINGKPKYPSIIYREESKVAYGINFHDINSDGFEDWIYSVPTSKKSVRLRLGSKDGFGTERSFDYPLSSFNPIPDFDNKKQFVGINKISKQVSVFAFTNEAEKTNTNSFQQLDFDLFPEGESDTGWIFSDFNKDGKKEILATSPSTPELYFMLKSDDNSFGGFKRYPTLTGISSLSPFQIGPNLNTGLLILSKSEEIIGLSKYDINKGFSFPKPLPLSFEPILSNSGDLNNDQVDEAFIIIEDDSDYILQIWSLKNGKTFQMSQEIKLNEWRREPSGIIPCYLNHDDFLDLVLISSREPAYLFLNDGKGKLDEIGEDSVLRKSFLREKKLSEIGFGDVENIGSPSLLVAAQGMVRALKWEDNDLLVKKQFNSTDPKAELLCPTFIDLNGDGKDELIYFSDNYWEGLQDNGNGEYEKVYKIEDCTVVPSKTQLIQSHKGDSLLSMGESTLQIISRSDFSKDPQLSVHSDYLTDLPKVSYTGVDWGDFNNDGVMDLVCLDGRRQTLEFLSLENGEWKSALHFEVFEKDLHYRGKKGGALEPRDGMVTDLNGDGLDDLVLLVHDRFLCYYQEEDSKQ